MVLCLREPPRRFLLYLHFVVDILHFIFDLHFCCHLSIFFIHILLFDITPHPSVDYCQVFKPILYFQPSPSQSDWWHFHFQPFCYLLTASATVLSGRFLPTGVFYLTLLHLHFWLKLRLSRPPWDPAVLLKFAGLYTDPQNTNSAHLFVWFTVIHKSFTRVGSI